MPLHATQKLQAYEGISLETIKTKGNSAQQKAASLFDANRDNKLTGDEVEKFNACIFADDPQKKELRIHERLDDGRVKHTTIKYNTPKDLDKKNMSYLEGTYRNKVNGKNHGVQLPKDYYKANIDFVDNKLAVSGAKGSTLNVIRMDTQISSSRLKYVGIAGPVKVDMYKVYGNSLFSNTADVRVSSTAVVTQKRSNVDVNAK